MRLSTDHILKDVEREKEEALAQRAAMQIDNEENVAEKPDLIVSRAIFVLKCFADGTKKA